MLTHLPLFQGDRRSYVVLITVALNQLDGFSQSLPLVLTGHSGVTRAVANFYPLTGEGHRKT